MSIPCTCRVPHWCGFADVEQDYLFENKHMRHCPHLKGFSFVYFILCFKRRDLQEQEKGTNITFKRFASTRGII